VCRVVHFDLRCDQDPALLLYLSRPAALESPGKPVHEVVGELTV
jgi:hypothetical protein